MTKSRQWVALGAVGCLALLAVGWFLLVSPQRSKIHQLHQDNASQQQRNAALLLELQTKEGEARGVTQKEIQLAALQAQIPGSPALPGLIRELVTSSSTAGVDLSSIQPGLPTALTALGDTPVSAPANGVLQIPLTLQVTGTYYNVEEFLTNLQAVDRALLVSGFSLAPGKSSGTSSPTLDVSITARAFMTNPDATATGASSAPASSAPASSGTGQ
jgi:Tfp pilus assembly protein PilO